MERVIVFGATGFLGISLVSDLLLGEHDVKAFCLPQDKEASLLPNNVSIIYGDILDINNVMDAINEGDCVIHLASLISILKKDKKAMWDVNVLGTRNIVEACLKKKASRLLYVSSSHVCGAKRGKLIDESGFNHHVHSLSGYEQSKLEATKIVLEARHQGLVSDVVFPTGIIGPGDHKGGALSNFVSQVLKGDLPYYVKGGYAFVDVRDVSKGIVRIIETAKGGESYIFSSGYASIGEIVSLARLCFPDQTRSKKLPKVFAYIGLPFIALRARISKQVPLYSLMSLKTIASPSNFDTSKARRNLNLVFRPLHESLIDMMNYIKTNPLGDFGNKKKVKVRKVRLAN